MRASGVSYEECGKHFGLSRDIVWRHWRLHVSPEQKAELVCGPVQWAELVAKAASESVSLIDYLALVRSRLLKLFLAGTDAGELHHSSTIAGRLLEVLRFQGKITGELLQHVGAGTTITNNIAIMQSPEYARLQSTIISALSPFPDARRAVIEALRAQEPIVSSPLPVRQPAMLEVSRAFVEDAMVVAA
jgi:hypothetical protein